MLKALTLLRTRNDNLKQALNGNNSRTKDSQHRGHLRSMDRGFNCISCVKSIVSERHLAEVSLHGLKVSCQACLLNANPDSVHIPYIVTSKATIQ
jgi:hypothetical protein